MLAPEHLVTTRPTYGLPSPVQNRLTPNNSLAYQLRALSGQQRAPLCRYRAFHVNKGLSHGEVEPSQVTQDPLRPTGCPLGEKKGSLGPKNGPLRANTLLVRPREGHLKPTQGPLDQHGDFLYQTGHSKA